MNASSHPPTGRTGWVVPGGSRSAPGPNARTTGSTLSPSNVGFPLRRSGRHPLMVFRPSKYHGDQWSQSSHWVTATCRASRRRVGLSPGPACSATYSAPTFRRVSPGSLGSGSSCSISRSPARTAT
jgi:hypothetical protein